MKMICKIAGAELRNLFYSPLAWLVIIFYFIVCGIAFTSPMDEYYRIQNVFTQYESNWRGFDAAGLTVELTWSVMSQLIKHLYLFIPLLTMGVINREVNAGTIKLLYSSPIRVRDIVLGKYAGLLSMVLLLVAIISIFLVSAVVIINAPDTARLFAYALCIFMVANVYIAIGLFISCVTNYQMVAGLLTFMVFFVLNSIGGLWQQYDLFREITFFLSIAGRANYLMNGLISTRDLCYFILVTILFLGFAIIKLRSTQESKPWTVAFFRYTALSLFILAMGYITGRPGQVAYWDLTRGQVNTITTSTQQVIKELDGSPLRVTLYTNLLGKNAVNGLPQNRNYYIWQVWERYRRFYPNMEFRYVYYYDIEDGDNTLYKQNPKKNVHQIAAKFAKELGIRQSLFLKPLEIRKQVHLGEESGRLIMQLEYKGRKTWLRTFIDNAVWPGEEHVAGAISRLTRDTVPKIWFTSGHYERNPYKVNERDYGNMALGTQSRGSLINLGVDVDTIDLRKTAIPAGAAVLAIADPRSAMDTAEQRRITEYLQQGGNALVIADLKKQQVLNPLLQHIGVTIGDGIIVRPNEHEVPHLFKATLTHAAGYMAQEQNMYLYQRRITKKLEVDVDGGVSLTYKEESGYRITPLITLKGDERTWIENGMYVADSAAPVFEAVKGDIKRDEYILGLSLEHPAGKKEQRIIVTGDADMFTMHRNLVIGNGFCSWLLYNRYPFYANYPGPRDTLFNAAPVTISILKIAYSWLIPAVLILFAVLLLVRRKRK